MNESELTALLGEHAARHAVPGAAIGILREGLVTTAYWGVADTGTGEPVTSETRFGVGSLTKSMVATVIAGFAETGRLSLDDPVAGHIPELRGTDWAQRATVLDLMANRSGLPMSAELEFGFAAHKDEDDGALSRLAAEAASAAGVAKGGTGAPAAPSWSYTNLGWCLLGRVIETVTDAPWEDAMQRHLFDKTWMRQTTFATQLDGRARVSGYEVLPDGAVPIEPPVARAYGPAGTRIVSTVTDLLRFAALHIEDSSLAVLRAVHSEVSIHGWLDSWCLGWARFDVAGHHVWGWDGLLGGERSVLRILPEHHAAMVLMTNGNTGRAMYRSLFSDLMPSLFDMAMPPLRLEPSPGAARDLSRYVGVYAWPDRRAEVEATARGLLIRTEQGEREALPLDERTFLVDQVDPDNPTVTFAEFDGAGRPRVLYLMLWGLPRVDA